MYWWWFIESANMRIQNKMVSYYVDGIGEVTVLICLVLMRVCLVCQGDVLEIYILRSKKTKSVFGPF